MPNRSDYNLANVELTHVQPPLKSLLTVVRCCYIQSLPIDCFPARAMSPSILDDKNPLIKYIDGWYNVDGRASDYDQ